MYIGTNTTNKNDTGTQLLSGSTEMTKLKKLVQNTTRLRSSKHLSIAEHRQISVTKDSRKTIFNMEL